MRLSGKIASSGALVALFMGAISQDYGGPASKPGATTASTAPKGTGSGSAGRQLLRGTVITRDGKRYTGVIRWGDEEAFWDDRFNATKEELPYADRLPEKDRPHSEIRFLGFIPIGFWEEGEKGRRFVARFGDIKEIQPQSESLAEVKMKDGTKYLLQRGGTEDIGVTLHMDDPKAGVVDLDWRSIERIDFEAAPAEAKPPTAVRAASAPSVPSTPSIPSRLYGEVTTEVGVFRGFILWDGQECLATDRLDGDSQNERISLEMGGIRAIERKSVQAALVETKDGRKLELSGTNDVDDSIRGILIEDDRYGRVKVPWHAFRRADFRDAPAPARGYADYPPGRPLAGKVTLRDGRTWQGRIVFDLDESETWEMLDGMNGEIEYSVPFERVRSLAPSPDKTTLVTMRNGQTLRLAGSQDVSDRNAGILVMKSGTEPEHYTRWADVARIDLD